MSKSWVLPLRCDSAPFDKTQGKQGHSIPRDAKVEWFTMSEPERSEGESNGGPGRIRTFEGISRQIYSLMHLATLLPTHV